MGTVLGSNVGTYHLQEAEDDRLYNLEGKVGRERQERIEKGCNKNDEKSGTDRRGNDTIDDPAISRCAGVRGPFQERSQDPKHNDGADELPDAQADQMRRPTGKTFDAAPIVVVGVTYKSARRS